MPTCECKQCVFENNIGSDLIGDEAYFIVLYHCGNLQPHMMGARAIKGGDR